GLMDGDGLEGVKVWGGRVHFPNGAAVDLTREAQRYERAVQAAGGIDLTIVGLGANGHIGFNEPASALVARTHVATLSLATRRANRSLFDGRLNRVPKKAISMGMATILQSNRIVLLATGTRKARAVAKAIDGPITSRCPASFLQLHPRCEVWLDRSAAALLADRRGSRRRTRSRRAELLDVQ